MISINKHGKKFYQIQYPFVINSIANVMLQIVILLQMDAEFGKILNMIKNIYKKTPKPSS